MIKNDDKSVTLLVELSKEELSNRYTTHTHSSGPDKAIYDGGKKRARTHQRVGKKMNEVSLSY